MNTLSQLLRQPVRFIAAILILTLSSSSICLGWGVVRSALATSEAVENSFLTIAVVDETPPSAGDEYVIEWLSPELKDELYSYLGNSEYLQDVYTNKYFSAVSESLRPPLSFNHSQYISSDYPYCRAVLLVKITGTIDHAEYGTAEEFISTTYYFEGEIIDYPALCPGYPKRSKITIHMSAHGDPDSLKAAVDSIEIGGTYLIYTKLYMDDEVSLTWDFLRNDLEITGALSEYDIEDFLSPITEEDREGWSEEDLTSRQVSLDGERVADKALYVINKSNGFQTLFYESDMKKIDHATVNVEVGLYEQGKRYEELFNRTYDEATKRNMGYDGTPMIQKIDGSLEDFLSDPQNDVWAERVNNCLTQYNTAPVIGTERLESIYGFHENIIYLTSGRGFSENDYKRGNNVCIISEQQAVESGLNIGDTISMSLYQDIPSDLTSCTASWYYASTELSKTAEFEIIGLYRNTAAYNAGSYYSADTIFVPARSLKPFDTGNIYMFGFTECYVMKNGSAEALREEIKAKGWQRYIAVFESGYSAVEDVINDLKQSSYELFAASSAVFVTVLIIYIALFVMKQRRNAGLILSLGAGKRRSVAFIVTISMIPAVISSFLGGVIGVIMLNRTVNAVFGDINDISGAAFSSSALSGMNESSIKITVTPFAAVSACLVIIAVYLAVITLVSEHISGKKPLDLLKK